MLYKNYFQYSEGITLEGTEQSWSFVEREHVDPGRQRCFAQRDYRESGMAANELIGSTVCEVSRQNELNGAILEIENSEDHRGGEDGLVRASQAHARSREGANPARPAHQPQRNKKKKTKKIEKIIYNNKIHKNKNYNKEKKLFK